MLYSLYSAADGSVSIDVRENDVIEAVHLETYTLAPVDGAVAKAELSFGSASQFTTNDASGIIASVANASDATVGVGKAMNSTFLSGIQVPINAGERLYLHTAKGSQTDQVTRCVIYTRKGASRQVNQRR